MVVASLSSDLPLEFPMPSDQDSLACMDSIAGSYHARTDAVIPTDHTLVCPPRQLELRKLRPYSAAVETTRKPWSHNNLVFVYTVVVFCTYCSKLIKLGHGVSPHTVIRVVKSTCWNL
jgi:hypothetical protein